MKALILAAGFGNRMRPLTDGTHKTLLKIAGQPIIDRIVSGLIDNNVIRIVVVTGYRSEELVSHLTDTFPGVEFEFVHNPRYRETNNIYSMALAFENIVIDDDILLIESDLIYESDVIARAINSKYPNVALVSPYRTGLDGTVVQVSGNRITNIFPPHLQDDTFNLFDKFKTLNVYRFSKQFCESEFKRLLVFYANAIDENCYYELILGILIYMQREEINCEIIENHKWAEVDDPNDLRGAEFTFNRENRLEIVEDSFGGYWNYELLDFCFIRNMYFPTRSMLSELRNNLPDLLVNYGSKQTVLNQKLAYVIQCQPERLVALNGAAQIYPILSRILSGRTILLPEPTFGEYPRMFSAACSYSDRPGIVKGEVEAKFEKCEVGVFVNPNNPTGTTIPSDWLIELADRYPQKLVVVDESFIEFSDESSVIDQLEAAPRENILVIKSMSKSYGVPGIRIGLVYTANQQLRQDILREIPIWNMNSIAEFYFEILLKNRGSLVKSFASTKADRALFAKELTDQKYFDHVYPSGGNFILVSKRMSSPEHESLVRYLLSNESMYVKEVTGKFEKTGDRHFRIAVRLPHENTALLDAINRFSARG